MGIILGCLVFQGVLFAEGASDPLLDTLPSDCLMCIRINQFEQTLNGLGQYLSGIAPMDFGGMVRMQLMGQLGNMNLAGINMAGDFAAYVPVTAMEQVGLKGMERPPLIMIPVTDYQQFLTAGTNISEPDDQGVCRIGEGTLVTQVGTYALIQPEGTVEQLLSTVSGLKQNKKSLASGLTPEEITSAQKQGLWVYVNIPQIAKTIGPELIAKVKSTSELMEQQVPMACPMAMSMGNAQAGFKMYTRMLEMLLKEAGPLTVQASADASALGVGLSLSDLPDTALHELLASTTAGQSNEKLLGYLQDGAMMNFMMHVDPSFLVKLNSRIMELCFFSEDIPMDEKARADMQSMMDLITKAMGRNLVFSMEIAGDTKPPFKGVFVFEPGDEKAYEEMITAYNDFMNTPSFVKTMQEQGMEIGMKNQKAVEEHQGVAIHSSTFCIKATDPNAPQAQFIRSMYGDGLELRWAVVNDISVGAMGPDADERIKKLIDQIKSGTVPPMGDEIKEAMALIPDADKVNFLATYNILRVFKMIPTMMPMSMPSIDFPSRSNMVMAGRINNGKAHYQMVLPKAHLMEMHQAFQQVMQQQMQMPQPGGPQPGVPMPPRMPMN